MFWFGKKKHSASRITLGQAFGGETNPLRGARQKVPCPFPLGFGIDALGARCVDEEKELRC